MPFNWPCWGQLTALAVPPALEFPRRQEAVILTRSMAGRGPDCWLEAWAPLMNVFFVPLNSNTHEALLEDSRLHSTTAHHSTDWSWCSLLLGAFCSSSWFLALGMSELVTPMSHDSQGLRIPEVPDTLSDQASSAWSPGLGSLLVVSSAEEQMTSVVNPLTAALLLPVQN